jgi:hypothetical protein
LVGLELSSALAFELAEKAMEDMLAEFEYFMSCKYISSWLSLPLVE